jgi:hypothetical protein
MEKRNKTIIEARNHCVKQGIIHEGKNILSAEELKNASAFDIVGAVNVGWNIGNTLEAYNIDCPEMKLPQEIDADSPDCVGRMWLDDAVESTAELIENIQKAGFNAVRIPVTWYKMVHIFERIYTIDPVWLTYVKSIVDEAYNRNMFVIINTHHDEWLFRFNRSVSSRRAIRLLWGQIAETFKDYDNRLLFESFNAPRHRNNDNWCVRANEEDWDNEGDVDMHININQWNQIFVNTVRNTGGLNFDRCLLLCTYAACGGGTPLTDFRLPLEPGITSHHGTSKFILSVHVNSMESWYDEINHVSEIAKTQNIPVIFGEWSSRHDLPEKERIAHAKEYITHVANSYRLNGKSAAASFWWDNRKES